MTTKLFVVRFAHLASLAKRATRQVNQNDEKLIIDFSPPVGGILLMTSNYKTL